MLSPACRARAEASRLRRTAATRRALVGGATGFLVLDAFASVRTAPAPTTVPGPSAAAICRATDGSPASPPARDDRDSATAAAVARHRSRGGRDATPGRADLPGGTRLVPELPGRGPQHGPEPGRRRILDREQADLRATRPGLPGPASVLRRLETTRSTTYGGRLTAAT